MKDPHIHVQHEFIFGFNFMREVISDAVGIAIDAPKTIRTGCDKRRPLTMTSTDPAKVTCLACMTYSIEYLSENVDMCEAALRMGTTDEKQAGAVRTQLTIYISLRMAFQTRMPS